ncbi:Pyridoxal phosphate-dependent transferase, major region [Cordyceps militaris CM01]|uniref:Pyridoxal phosphate-dependent transferase, major region n=1 Tax=Cordyceps militaris (strain CM01) TaxID=983644 RepID=G3J552_CORMM|nr:Pyridoxal phosphate-dependent transferase, major region [Cordyceps militaris CM01]EGX95966.1 Pyridoxal phosphate-dependent transferase, major region [Cordyceps militaris CM01]
MDKKPLNVAIIGIGHRGYKTHFSTLISHPRSWTVVAVCDADSAARQRFASKHPDISAYSDLSQLLQEHKHHLHFAVVCVPHRFHLPCCAALAAAGVAVLKEKPVAESRAEYETLRALPVKIGVTFQKRFEPRYLAVADLLHHVGQVASVTGTLAASIAELDATWRAGSGVGVTEDLGCHMLDMMVSLFGRPTSVVARSATGVRAEQSYGGDDVANVIMNFGEGAAATGQTIIGHVHLSRVAHRDQESLVITGTNGTFTLEGNDVTLKDGLGHEIFRLADASTKTARVKAMLQKFSAWVAGGAPDFAASLDRLADTVSVMEAIRHSYSNPSDDADQSVVLARQPPLSETAPAAASLDGAHHVWPLLSAESETAVVDQMHRTLSIYDRSDIYETFEDRWRTMHGLKHALVCSSGTIAILHMFDALGLRPGDEILCPVYTFFATASPLLQYGAVPVFCDALADGNLDPAEILARTTPRTRAVIVTHMWGLPCRMSEIVANARQVGIKVLEDCSHAHGAVVDGKMVGAWGDMAAWSMQAKKNIMGGQAGVMATNSTDYYSRAILHGHFNKRAKQEVPTDHPLRKFWLTGIGLNLRAHPLAIALANQQLDLFERHDATRQAHAGYMARELSAIPFLTMPAVGRDADKHAWYAFVMQFDASKAPRGLTRDVFVRRLTEQHGLTEVDIPKSTGLLHDLPLFTHPHEAIPRFGDAPWYEPQPTSEFPRARRFYDQAIKLPVWSTEADAPIVAKYVKAFLEAARAAVPDADGFADRGGRRGLGPQPRL